MLSGKFRVYAGAAAMVILSLLLVSGCLNRTAEAVPKADTGNNAAAASDSGRTRLDTIGDEKSGGGETTAPDTTHEAAASDETGGSAAGAPEGAPGAVTAEPAAVPPEEPAPVLPDKLIIVFETSVMVGTSQKPSVSFTPGNVTDKSVTWKSSDDDILSVKDGVITANKIGSAKITATHASGLTATMTIEVTPVPAETVLLHSNSFNDTVFVGEKLKLEAAVLPENTTDKTIKWTSDDPKIASVKDGTVTGVSAGKTTIRATASNKVTAAYVVTVKAVTQMMVVAISCDYRIHGDYPVFAYFSVDGAPVESGSIIAVKRGQSLRIYTEITVCGAEDDETDTDSATAYITDHDFDGGFTITRLMSVMFKDSKGFSQAVNFNVKYTFIPV